jgi:polysaccharide export outer membrane protein
MTKLRSLDVAHQPRGAGDVPSGGIRLFADSAKEKLMGNGGKLVGRVLVALVVVSAIGLPCASIGQTATRYTATASTSEEYRVQPGDMLYISVWREETLQREVMVQPDGAIRFPLAGEVKAAGHTLAEIEAQLSKQLSKFIPDPVLSVSLLQSLGNRIYVVGRVNNPGEHALTGTINVMQAIALAGGMTPFAKKSKIKILRGQKGKQKTLMFNYKEVEKGENLRQNITLFPGDTVIVP